MKPTTNVRRHAFDDRTAPIEAQAKPADRHALTVGMEAATPQAMPERMTTSSSCPNFTRLPTVARRGLNATHEQPTKGRNTVADSAAPPWQFLHHKRPEVPPFYV